jgi:hypothetical protein
MKKLIIFGTYHQVQGVQGADDFKNIYDPDYKTLLEELIQLHDVKFIFEEASGFGPSVASEMATVPYLDIDFENTYDAQSKFPEPPETMFHPRSKVQETACKLGLEVQNWRESRWVFQIKDQQFETGLVICGLLHSLSIAFRLQLEGFNVHVYTYQPIKRLCVSYGMRPPAKSGVDDVPMALSDGT